MRFFLRVLSSLGLSVLFGTAVAQSQNPGLAGVQTVRLLVEPIDDAAKECGLSMDMLDAAMRIPVSNSQLRFANTVISPHLYLNVMVLKRDICFVAINMNLNRVVWLDPNGNGAASASVWDTGSVLSGPPHGMGTRVSQAVEGHTKQFIGAWLRAN